MAEIKMTAFDAAMIADGEFELTAMLLVITELAKDFAAIYGADNPAFDRARFLAACGIT